ncbi:MAG: hypothetical protein AAF713_01155 [Pseudomonadota bacterium]
MRNIFIVAVSGMMLGAVIGVLIGGSVGLGGHGRGLNGAFLLGPIGALIGLVCGSVAGLFVRVRPV